MKEEEERFGDVTTEPNDGAAFAVVVTNAALFVLELEPPGEDDVFFRIPCFFPPWILLSDAGFVCEDNMDEIPFTKNISGFIRHITKFLNHEFIS